MRPSVSFRFTVATCLCFAAFICGFASSGAAGELPPHPRILFAKDDIAAIKDRCAKLPGAKARLESLKKQADDWAKRDVKLPPRGGQWYHYYSCPKHGARLKMESSTRHVCPVDKEVLTGYPYDDVALMGDHNNLAGAIRTLGMAYQLTGEKRYADKAKEILLAYAAKYDSYPLHTIKNEAKVGGGKVGPQTLDESTWLITVVEGADCIWDTLTADEQAVAKGKLFLPATKVIRDHKMGIHNIQCWKNSAVGLTGLLLGDMQLVDEALKAESGYFSQMKKGTTPDGAWYEGAWGYHFYTVSAVVRLTEGAFHSGVNLYQPEFKGMFDAPITFAMPDLRLPAFNDSGTASVAGSAWMYEIAYARYKDPRYCALLAQSKRDSDQTLLCGVTELPAAAPAPAASRNYPASGVAILTAGPGADATWFCVDYGPHGGGHGHPDKLGFVLYGMGQIIAPDPGTANYGVPIQGGWFRTTLAHNTLTIDEDSQKAAEGKCEAFVAADGFSAVTASAGAISPGVSFRRTTALIGDKLLVFIDQVRADKEHTFDLAYHNVGKCAAPGEAQPFELPKKPGYSYLRDAKSVAALPDGLLMDMGGGKEARFAIVPDAAQTLIVATGVGAHTEDRVPMVIARRKAKECVFLWAVALGKPAEKIVLAAEAVTGNGEAAAVRVTTAAGAHIVVANPAGAKVTVAGAECAGKIVHLTTAGNGKAEVKHRADGVERAQGFLGLPDDAIRKVGDDAPESAVRDVTKITRVETTTYDEYLRLKKEGAIKAEEKRDGHVYYAIEARRDCPFPNGTSAWVFVTERYKAKLPDGMK
jgi:hypothetical protein